MPMQRGSSFANTGRRPGSSGTGRPGNAVQQQFALSGKATLADIPYLYGMPGGLAGGGQEKEGGGFDQFAGAPPLGADTGAGPGSSGGYSGGPSGLPGGGELPVTPGDLGGSQSRSVYTRPGGGGEGGNSDTAGMRAADTLGFGAADPTLANIASAANFGLSAVQSPVQMGLQEMAHLAFPDTIPSGMPNLTGAYKPENYLSQEEIQQLARAATPAEAARIKAGLMAKAQQRFDSERFDSADKRIGNAAVDRLANPALTGFSGPAGPVGADNEFSGASFGGPTGRGSLADVGRRSGLMDRARAAGRSGPSSGGGGYAGGDRAATASHDRSRQGAGV